MLLAHVSDELRRELGEQLLAVLVFGSLALGDFNPHTSDVDIVVVTHTALSEVELERLSAMHRRIFQSGLALADQLECSYIPRAELWRHVPERAFFPHVDRGEAVLSIQQHHSDWVIQRYSLHEFGFSVFGPSPAELVASVTSQELHQAVRDLRWWWELQLVDTSRVEQAGYQVYSVLSMCRILYTLQTGTITSKPAAARWGLGALPERFHTLVQDALAWQNGPYVHLAETLALIRYTLERI